MVAEAVGRYHDAVFEEGYHPACKNGKEDRGVGPVLQMVIPGEGHEDVGEYQKGSVDAEMGDLHIFSFWLS